VVDAERNLYTAQSVQGAGRLGERGGETILFSSISGPAEVTGFTNHGVRRRAFFGKQQPSALVLTGFAWRSYGLRRLEVRPGWDLLIKQAHQIGWRQRVAKEVTLNAIATERA
jgi:hypothetical protein